MQTVTKRTFRSNILLCKYGNHSRFTTVSDYHHWVCQHYMITKNVICLLAWPSITGHYNRNQIPRKSETAFTDLSDYSTGSMEIITFFCALLEHPVAELPSGANASWLRLKMTWSPFGKMFLRPAWVNVCNYPKAWKTDNLRQKNAEYRILIFLVYQAIRLS